MNLRNQFALQFAVLSCFLKCTNAQYRIWNGNDWNIEKSPYLVSIHHFGVYTCTGALISMQTVITAAHCVAHVGRNLIQVAAGVTDLNDIRENGQIRSVRSVHYPDGYNFQTAHMDIVVIKLLSPFIPGPKVQIIALCDTKLNLGIEMQVSGWGATSGDNMRASCTLQTTHVNIVPTQECTVMAAMSNRMLTESMICANRDGTSTCEGDSGAPGIVNGALCAVVSYGKGCAYPGYPNVYTDVTNAKVRRFLRRCLTSGKSI